MGERGSLQTGVRSDSRQRVDPRGRRLRSGSLATWALAAAVASWAACSEAPVDYRGKTCSGTTCPDGLPCLASVCGGPTGDAAPPTDGAMTDGAPNATADAPFEAASIDGGGCDANLSNDESNCGWCGHACGGLGCANGVCDGQPLLPGVDVSSMTIADGVLYYTADGAVFSYDIASGGGSPVLLADEQVAAGYLALHAPYIYFANGDGTINRILEDGGALTPELATGQGVRCMSANSTYVYWWSQATSMPFRLPLAASPGQDADVFYPVTVPDYNGCVSVDDAFAAVAVPTGLVFHDLVTEAGAVVEPPSGSIVASTMTWQLLALAGTHTYFFTHDDAGGGALNHATTGAIGPATPLVPFVWADASALAADGVGVYWAIADGFVHGCSDPLCTEGPRLVAAVQQVTALALDASFVYVAGVDPTTPGQNSVYRFAR